jgi:murein DD-endopeptidase MepM/ murein hydrolase activator NlpD
VPPLRPVLPPLAAAVIGRKVFGVAIAGVVLTGSALAGPVLTADAAHAASYPSWSDVLAARGKESATNAKVAELRSALTGLRDRADDALDEAERLGESFAQAQMRADEQAAREQSLRAEAAESAETAAESAAQAGRFAAQTARVGGGSMTATLLTDGEDADDVLAKVGAMSKLTQRARGIETTAAADAATVRSLTAQADRAANALARLADDAESRMTAAQRASDRASAAVAEQEQHEATLEAQLATLTSGRVRTEAEFRTGEAARIAAARKAAEEAARKAAAEAAAAAAANRPKPGGGNAGGNPGAGNSGGTKPPVGGSGWVRPGVGGITSAWGYRVHPVTGAVTMHDGIDLGSGCSTTILAANSGTVEFAGWYGGYGNYVRLLHGDGNRTAYGHIVSGGILVSPGQRVVAGQPIALVGSTGTSTGCHLHFETRPSPYQTVNPVTFMAARGVRF